LEDVAHGVDGCLVGALLVAPAHHAGRRQGGRLGDPDELKGQVAVRAFPLGLVAHSTPGGFRRAPLSWALQTEPARIINPATSSSHQPMVMPISAGGAPGLSITPRKMIMVSASSAVTAVSSPRGQDSG